MVAGIWRPFDGLVRGLTSTPYCDKIANAGADLTPTPSVTVPTKAVAARALRTARPFGNFIKPPINEQRGTSGETIERSDHFRVAAHRAREKCVLSSTPAIGAGDTSRREAVRSVIRLRIDHSCLLDALGGFPAKGLIEGWLKAGVVENRRFAPTEEGTPQGGVVSPLLLNVALHGMEEAAGVRYLTTGTKAGRTVAGSPVVVRYADDLVAMCTSREQAEQVKERLRAWLAPRGLTFNEDKTRIVPLDDGFDFLVATRGRTVRVGSLIGGSGM